MPRTSKRTRIAEGCYRDNLGLSAVVKVNGVWNPQKQKRLDQTREKRFPLGTDLQTLKAWRDKAKVELRAKTMRVVRGTFSADAARFLKLIKGTVSKETFKGYRSEMRAWVSVFAEIKGHDITSHSIMAALGTWRTAGVSPKTVRNRVRTLGRLFTMLYQQALPMSGVELPKIPKRRPAFVTAATIMAVEAKLRSFEEDGSRTYKGPRVRDSRQRARFMVMATCGMRPAQLKRMTPEDVDLDRRVALIPAAKGGEPVGLWLNSEMLAAWQTFGQANAWGHFDTRAYGRLLRAAGWPPGIRPYNARHAVGIELAERGVDFRTIADMLGHTDDATTRAFYVPVLSSKLRSASELLDGRLGWMAPEDGTVKAKPEPRARIKKARGS